VSSADLTPYLERPLTPPAPSVLAALEQPIDPADALPLADVDRLLDPTPLRVENGWCTLPDGCGYVAVSTAMPGVTAEMVDWWFDWHADESIRYRIWHPLAHAANSVKRPEALGAKRHWHTVHHPVEDVGTGMVKARIEFLPPSQVGMTTDALDDPAVATIVCGYAGDDTRRVRHTPMFHVFLRDPDGVTLRSRFWLGAALPRLLNNRVVRRIAMPSGVAPALARHCAEEYANLGVLLPELHARFGA
jgi:catechol 2,3-dioxygenase-like lactoylglutathione lyase family enzyme